MDKKMKEAAEEFMKRVKKEQQKILKIISEQYGISEEDLLKAWIEHLKS